ncbi:hypothetical protein EGK75_13965, partial [Neisseria weixii]
MVLSGLNIMIRKFLHLFIMVGTLLGFNGYALAIDNADIVVDRDGRQRIPIGGFNENGIRPWKYISGNGKMFHYEYSSVMDKSVRYAPTGDRSTSKVPAKLTASVSRQTVLNSAFSIAKGGAR